MFEKILKDKDTREILGLILFVSIIGFYLYENPSIINAYNTSRIKIKLSTKPDYEESNGDNVSNISFKAKGYSNYFDISHCALDLIDISKIIKLNIGDKLVVTVDKIDLKSKPMKLVYKPITVCGIELANNETILTLDSYNSCERNGWKRVTQLGIIVIGLILFLRIVRIGKTMANKK